MLMVLLYEPTKVPFIEEAFKVLKYRLYLEQFTGELPESIRQDVHAKIFTANLAEALAQEAYDALPGEKAAHYYPNVTLYPQLFEITAICLAYPAGTV